MSDKVVMIELVIDVPEHKDLIYGSGAIWHGKGDQQPVPEDKAVLFLRHDDVYCLPGQRPSKALASAQKKAEQSAANLDAVYVSRVNGLDLTAEQLDAMPDEDVAAEAAMRQYGLHPRLTPVNMRLRFLETQAAKAAEQSTTGFTPV